MQVCGAVHKVTRQITSLKRSGTNGMLKQMASINSCLSPSAPEAVDCELLDGLVRAGVACSL